MTFNYRPVTWVLAEKVHELTGRSVQSLNNLVHAGVLVEGTHWKWSEDNRRYFNLEELDKWVSNSNSKGSMRGKRRSSSASTGKEDDTAKESRSLQPQQISGLRLA